MDPFKYNPPSQQQQQQPFTVYRSSSSSSSAVIANNTLEDISFSSYLKPKPKSPENENDTEISIFDAQKYFSSDPKLIKKPAQHELPPSPEKIPRVSLTSSADGYSRNFRTRSFHATPTASSEASWNSQTGLLANPNSSSIVFPNSDSKKQSPVSGKWFFGRKCCCTGKKSVQVKKLAPEHYGGTLAITNNSKRGRNVVASSTTLSQRSSDDVIMQIPPIIVNPLRLSPEDDFPAPPRQHRISSSGRPFADAVSGFSFPILKPAMVITKMEEPPRESLEVFQPARAAAPPCFNPGSPIARVGNTDDDVGSDASSDLFEIESFSTQTTSYPMYRRRDSLDEAPTFNARRFANSSNSLGQYGGARRSLDEKSVAATECYAPSEVSIDWSVTTAEGFDRASVSNFSISASEMGSAAFLRQRLQHQQEEAAVGGDGGKRKGSGGGGGGGLMMMSCRQEKAVSVGPQPVKFVPQPVEGGGPQFFPGGRPPRAAANKAAPLGSDHSARLSLAFAA